MREAAVLVQKGVIQDREDVYYLSFEEFRDVVHSGHLDYSVIAARKEEYAAFEKMTPPRVMTSEGEVISGEYEHRRYSSAGPGGHARILRRHRGARPHCFKDGGCQPGRRRYPGNHIHRSQLDAAVSIRQGSGDGGGRVDDPWVHHCPRVRTAGGCRRGKRHQVD